LRSFICSNNKCGAIVVRAADFARRLTDQSQNILGISKFRGRGDFSPPSPPPVYVPGVLSRSRDITIYDRIHVIFTVLSYFPDRFRRFPTKKGFSISEILAFPVV